MNCVAIAELLCAYADGELAESSRKTVENHLLVCDNCSAILRIYKEISSSVYDTNPPAPEALCVGVMNRIRSESIPRPAVDTKKRKTYFQILTRVVPVAACLVIGLLVWYNRDMLWGGMRANDAMPVMAGGGMGTMADAPATEQAAGDMAFSFEEGINDDADEAGAGNFENQNITDGGGDAATRRTYLHPEGTITELESITIEGLYDEEAKTFLNNSYAILVLSGSLPGYLNDLTPNNYSSLETWETVYEINRSDLQKLLEIINEEGKPAEIAYNNNDSNYVAIVVLK